MIIRHDVDILKESMKGEKCLYSVQQKYNHCIKKLIKYVMYPLYCFSILGAVVSPNLLLKHLFLASLMMNSLPKSVSL